MAGPDADLLQAFEHVLEMTRRQAVVIRQLITTMQAGGRLSDEALAEYVRQLDVAETDRARLEASIVELWRQMGHEQSH